MSLDNWLLVDLQNGVSWPNSFGPSKFVFNFYYMSVRCATKWCPKLLILILAINFPWSHFQDTFYPSLSIWAHILTQLPTSSHPPVANLLVPMTVPRCIILCAEFTGGCGCSRHLWKELERLWSWRDLYTFTCSLFPQITVIQAKINASHNLPKLAFSWHFMCQA